MYPELFHFSFWGVEHTLYSYAFLIVSGTLIAALYTKWQAKKEMGIMKLSNTFFYLIFIAGFVGGKIFYYLERPMFYWNNLHLLLNNFSGGFVFYGSFITIIPVVVWYLKSHKIPLFTMLDILAITTLIVHSIGRMGCFLGGCCYGKKTDSFIGMAFPATGGTKVHPSQLYEVIALIAIMLILFQIKKRQTFQGQLFLTYIILYAITRNFLELFRGDKRGFIIDNVLSHSQLIGIILILITIYSYQKIKNKSILKLYE